MKVQVYRNLTKGVWSVRSAGRVIGHCPSVIPRSCAMRVREGGRRAAILSGHRSVHAWIEGDITEDVDDENLVEIGYNPFLAPTFTMRPGFEPIHAARLVVFDLTGKAYAIP